MPCLSAASAAGEDTGEAVVGAAPSACPTGDFTACASQCPAMLTMTIKMLPTHPRTFCVDVSLPPLHEHVGHNPFHFPTCVRRGSSVAENELYFKVFKLHGTAILKYNAFLVGPKCLFIRIVRLAMPCPSTPMCCVALLPWQVCTRVRR